MEEPSDRPLVVRPSLALTVNQTSRDRIMEQMVENALAVAKEITAGTVDLDALVREAKRIQGNPGMTPENIRAFNLFFRAAMAGHAEAELEVGTCFAFGIGIECDSEEGFRWFTRAASKRNLNAQFMLGLSHSLGKGVPQDYRNGYAWFRLASDGGLKEATKKAAALASAMSPSDLETAERLYDAIKKRYSAER